MIIFVWSGWSQSWLDDHRTCRMDADGHVEVVLGRPLFLEDRCYSFVGQNAVMPVMR
jgi:hypothetical protein